MNAHSNIIVRNAQKVITDKQAAQGFVTLLDLTEYQDVLTKAADANQAHRTWMQAHGLGQYDPSELFASI